MIPINNDQALLAFSCFTKFGPIKIRQLEKYFGSAKSAFSASPGALEYAGIKTKIISEFIKWREKFDINQEEERLNKEGIKYICRHNPSYPPLLKEIYAAPYILYFKGKIESLDNSRNNCLAVVGSRKHSAYAERIINQFIPTLIKEDIIIISGLALGIDSLAHRATLANNGITVAVLGSGLDAKSIYPASNRLLAKEIVEAGGVLISEFPLGAPALRQNFPQRNRIISGLAEATLIIEAGFKSGSLITANYALEQNRDVLCVPGNIFSEYSDGTNNLIKLGAKVITTAIDILDYFDISTTNNYDESANNLNSKFTPADKTEELIYLIIKRAHERAERITSDEIVNISKLDTSVINSKLSILELRGIANYDGISYDIN